MGTFQWCPYHASADFAAGRMTRRSLDAYAPNHFSAHRRSRVWLLETTLVCRNSYQGRHPGKALRRAGTGLPVGLQDGQRVAAGGPHATSQHQKDQESLEENYCREHGTGFGPRPGGYDRSLC